MHLDQQIRGHNADPRSEPTPACNRFEFLIGAMQSIPIIRWTRASSCVLVLVHGPGRGQSDPSSGSRARAGRPRQEHGPILRPVDRTDALRGYGACAPLGSHREPRARADRPTPVSAGRADRAREMARSQEAARIPAPTSTMRSSGLGRKLNGGVIALLRLPSFIVALATGAIFQADHVRDHQYESDHWLARSVRLLGTGSLRPFTTPTIMRHNASLE